MEMGTLVADILRFASCGDLPLKRLFFLMVAIRWHLIDFKREYWAQLYRNPVIVNSK